MPKKFQGENSKAAEAKARKEMVRVEEKNRKEKEAEDKLWQDDDKNVARKLERKEDKEKKQQEAIQKKLERDRLLEEEMASIKGAKATAAATKVSRAHIDNHQQQEREKAAKLQNAKPKSSNICVVNQDEDEEPEQNLNRLTGDGIDARSVDEALKELSVDDDPSSLEKHPERRARAAYLVFEEREMARLKEEYPNFRLSQLKQMLKKEWQKSPENPFNGPLQKYNAKSSALSSQEEE